MKCAIALLLVEPNCTVLQSQLPTRYLHRELLFLLRVLLNWDLKHYFQSTATSTNEFCSLSGTLSQSGISGVAQFPAVHMLCFDF